MMTKSTLPLNGLQKKMIREWNAIYKANRKRVFDPSFPLSAAHVAYVISHCLEFFDFIGSDYVSIPELLSMVKVSRSERRAIVSLSKTPSKSKDNTTVLNRITSQVSDYAVDPETATTIRIRDMFNVLADVYRTLCEEFDHKRANSCLYLARLVYAAAALAVVSPRLILEKYSNQKTLNKCAKAWKKLTE